MIAGQTVNKVGRTTGWTTGSIDLVCDNTLGYNSFRENQAVVLYCSYRSNGMRSDPGDSGSPIFQCWDNVGKKQVKCPPKSSTSQDVQILGILYGGPGTKTDFSPIGLINMGNQSGVQNVPNELGPLTTCAINDC
jgi:hypothetical protein